MSERFILNKKAFAATRALARGKDADKKWDYMHVSKAGVICTDTTAIIRVSLPKQDNVPSHAQVFTSDMFEKLRPTTADETVTMPEGLEPKSNGTIAVPNFAATIPNSDAQVACVTVSAKQLIELLKAACEVTDHARQLVRLRICGDEKNQKLRIDAHRDADGQEFCAVLMGAIYKGVNIPGDPTGPKQETAPSEEFDEKKLTLPMTEGRKFRD